MKEKITLFVLLLTYLLCSIRYFPGQWQHSLLATLRQMLVVAPIAVGMTLIAVSFFQRLAGEKLPGERVLRIFLMLGIIGEFFFGLADYLGQ